MPDVLINLLVPREYEGKTYGPGEDVKVPAGLAREMGVQGTPVKATEAEPKPEPAKPAAKITAKK